MDSSSARNEKSRNTKQAVRRRGACGWEHRLSFPPHCSLLTCYMESALSIKTADEGGGWGEVSTWLGLPHQGKEFKPGLASLRQLNVFSDLAANSKAQLSCTNSKVWQLLEKEFMSWRSARARMPGATGIHRAKKDLPCASWAPVLTADGSSLPCKSFSDSSFYHLRNLHHKAFFPSTYLWVIHPIVLSVSCSVMSVACQAPLSMEFSKQKYWVGCHSLLQGIFLTQESNLGLLHCRRILYHLSHQGNPYIP